MLYCNGFMLYQEGSSHSLTYSRTDQRFNRSKLKSTNKLILSILIKNLSHIHIREISRVKISNFTNFADHVIYLTCELINFLLVIQ